MTYLAAGVLLVLFILMLSKVVWPNISKIKIKGFFGLSSSMEEYCLMFICIILLATVVLGTKFLYSPEWIKQINVI